MMDLMTDITFSSENLFKPHVFTAYQFRVKYCTRNLVIHEVLPNFYLWQTELQRRSHSDTVSRDEQIRLLLQSPLLAERRAVFGRAGWAAVCS